jgi:hypothetical protein
MSPVTAQSGAQSGGRPAPLDLALVLAVDVSGSVDEGERRFRGVIDDE